MKRRSPSASQLSFDFAAPDPNETSLQELAPELLHRLSQLPTAAPHAEFASDISPAIAFVEHMGSVASAQQAIAQLERIHQLLR